jgi:hypothetical protein
MAKTPEGLVKDKITKVLKEYGVYYFYPPANGYGQSGRFDICCSYRGHFIGIEVKADIKKRPTALQTKNAEAAANSGASVFLIHKDNITELIIFLEGMKTNATERYSRTHIWAT